jgi:cytidylate kinase
VVIAIDGPGGVGKTTLARAVAAALGLPHLDTGSYYRAATLAVLEAGADPADTGAVVRIVAAADYDYRDRHMHLDGRDVSVETRTPEVTALVSPVSAIPELRTIVVAAQRDWVRRHGGSAVVEGRDIGTVVFPDAQVKVYLTADPEVRARRRLGDAEASDVDPERVAELLRMRDRIDSTRTVSPLRPADDAVVVDTSHLTAEEVVDVVLRLVEAAEASG